MNIIIVYRKNCAKSWCIESESLKTNTTKKKTNERRKTIFILKGKKSMKKQWYLDLIVLDFFVCFILPKYPNINFHQWMVR